MSTKSAQKELDNIVKYTKKVQNALKKVWELDGISVSVQRYHSLTGDYRAKLVFPFTGDPIMKNYGYGNTQIEALENLLWFNEKLRGVKEKKGTE